MNHFGKRRSNAAEEIARTPSDQLAGWRDRLQRRIDAIDAEMRRRRPQEPAHKTAEGESQ